MKNRWVSFAGLCLTIVCTALIVLFSLEASEKVPTVTGWLPFSDKVGHFLAYAALGFSLGLWRRPRHSYISEALTYALVLGVGLELIQPFFGRTRSGGDVIADLLGAIWGLCCLYIARRLASSLWKKENSMN